MVLKWIILWIMQKVLLHVHLEVVGATFHHCRTLHYTGPNCSTEPRRAYTLQFQCNTKERDQPRPNSWNETKTTEREKRAKESGWNLRAP